MVVVATAAFWWWLNQAPEAVDLEAAVVQLEAASLDDLDISSTTRGSEDVGINSTSGPDPSADTPELTSTDDALSTDPGAAVKSTSTEAPPATRPTEDVGDRPGTGSETSGVSSEGVTDDTPSGGTVSEETASTGGDGEAFAGLWTVAATEHFRGLPGEPAVSFAGFRVVEVLMGSVAESTAVGRTADVTGFIELASGRLVAAEVEVKLATLRTDNSHRDSHMRQALDTNQFPLAVFTLIDPVDLPVGVFGDETFTGTALGELTIKGVTNRAAFELQARVVGDTIVVAGSSDVVFSDYGVPTPTSASVISVEDHGVIELLLFFHR